MGWKTHTKRIIKEGGLRISKWVVWVSKNIRLVIRCMVWGKKVSKPCDAMRTITFILLTNAHLSENLIMTPLILPIKAFNEIQDGILVSLLI